MECIWDGVLPWPKTASENPVRDARRWSRLAKDDRISSGVGLFDEASSDDVLFAKHLDGTDRLMVGVVASVFRQVRQRCLSRIGAILLSNRTLCWKRTIVVDDMAYFYPPSRFEFQFQGQKNELIVTMTS